MNIVILGSTRRIIPAPTGVVATPGNTQNVITWNAVTGAVAYDIYWKTTAGVTKANGTKIAGVTSPYTHTGRVNGTTYYYVVVARTNFSESVISSEVNATPVAPLSLVVQPDTADILLMKSDPDTSFHNLTYIAAARPSNFDLYHSLLKFNFSALTAGANISSAVLGLNYYADNGASPAGEQLDVRRITQTAWTTGGTWNKYDGTHAWTTLGGDYTDTDGGSVLMPASFGVVNIDITNLIKYCQANTAKIANLLIKWHDETSVASWISSKFDGLRGTITPILTIIYTL